MPISFAAQIRIAWDANTESDLAGYKVYYGSSSGSYGAPIDVGNVTTYTINGLTLGQTYYIAVTAYDTSNNESDFSNEVNGPATDGTQIYTVTTNPSGLQITVEENFIAPQIFNWAAGSIHTISVSSPQYRESGIRYVFSCWNDEGNRTHNITASSRTTYIANFTSQFSLNTSVSPAGAGTVSPSGTIWYNRGRSVTISATSSAGYTFSGWSGDITGSANPTMMEIT